MGEKVLITADCLPKMLEIALAKINDLECVISWKDKQIATKDEELSSKDEEIKRLEAENENIKNLLGECKEDK